MIKIVCSFLFFIFLASVELGLVYALPFPIDRFPLVLCVSVFAFQSLDIRHAPWWIIGQGFLLDLLLISFVSFELFSYAVVSIVTILTAQRVFSNRSYWGILGTLTISIITLTFMEVGVSMVMGFWDAYHVPIQTILSVRAWGWGLSVAALLLFFPLHEFFMRIYAKLLRI